MKENEYFESRAKEAKAERQPSKEHKQPAVMKDPKSGKPIYREQL